MKGIEELRQELDNSFSLFLWQRKLAQAAEKAYRRAYALCPVDTGWMQGQLKLIPAGVNHWVLECLCDYAEANEYGWSGIPFVPDPPNKVKYKGGYRPFMRIGALEGERWFEEEIKRVLKKKLRHAHVSG